MWFSRCVLLAGLGTYAAAQSSCAQQNEQGFCDPQELGSALLQHQRHTATVIQTSPLEEEGHGTWEITSGTGCTVVGDCIASLNYPLEYGVSQSCSIDIQGTVEITSEAFNTEQDYDKLQIGSHEYSGSTGPSGSVTGSITWSSDFSVQAGGWKICKGSGAPTPAPTPALTPAPASGAGTWEITSGTGCTVVGDCIASLNYPLEYGVSQSCSIDIQGTVEITSEAFNTEQDYDKLQIGSHEYSGSTGPSGSVTGSITWSSDFSVQAGGWKICKGSGATPLAPTPGPTPAVTTAPTTAPTPAPTIAPTPAPTLAPTPAPTNAPTPAPTIAPTPAPTNAPTPAPTIAPTPAPINAPTLAPTIAPTPAPINAPTPASSAVMCEPDMYPGDDECPFWESQGHCTDELSEFIRPNCKTSCAVNGCLRPTTTPMPKTAECIPLSAESTGQSPSMKIVLVGSAFGDDISLWQEKAQWIYGIFEEYPPMNAGAIPQLSVHYVRIPADGDNGKKCWHNCSGIARLMCCDEAYFERHAMRQCGSGSKMQVLVIHNSDTYGGAGGRVATASINPAAPQVAIHEIGHSMFGLGDEYTSSQHNLGNVPVSPNCDVPGCPKWNDMIGDVPGVACFPGRCGHGKWSAPAEGTVMNYLSEPFGPVNERITCCKYILETGGVPPYCHKFESGNHGLRTHCERHVWDRETSLLSTGEEIIIDHQGLGYVELSAPVEWELIKSPMGQWHCVKIGALTPGFYPKDEVYGDTAIPITGGRIRVDVHLGAGGHVLRQLVFNEFDTVEVPPAERSDSEDDGAVSEAPEQRSDINVILSQGEYCRIV
mmetsp:Transcript_91604/g.196381  ORF Transcript_91604/g.196381 Transcript_91604/m.196381 type:complete len:823 (+) Transcript_91604:70-2538(+)